MSATAEVERPDIIAAASAKVDEWAGVERKLEADDEVEARAVYAEILLRLDSPRDDDARALATVMQRLGLSQAHVERDRQMLKEARNEAESIVDEPAAAREMVAAGEANQALYRKQQDEEKAVRRRFHAATERHHLSVIAAARLQIKRDRRPELFDDGDPPRVRVPADAAPPKKARRGKAS